MTTSTLDWRAIAAALRNSKARIDEASQMHNGGMPRNDAWDTVCQDLASALERANPGFDRPQFLLACCDTVADRNRLVETSASRTYDRAHPLAAKP